MFPVSSFLVSHFQGIATRLWERGIRAEYIYERSEDGMEDDAVMFCQEKRIPVVVVLNARYSDSDSEKLFSD
jgi:hypothetical protein